MGEILKNNWFVVLIAVILISFIGYFIFDSNRYNISSKSVDGKDVLATIDGSDVTADKLYDELDDFDSTLLFNMYRNAVVEQSVEETKDLKKKAKNLESIIRQNAQSKNTNYEASLSAELATYGYKSVEELEDYCMMSVKEKAMNEKYVNEHFDEVKKALDEKSPRTISILSMRVVNADKLSEKEQEKKDNIDKALKNGSFADAATAFSEDTATASTKGFYGYVDLDSKTSSSTLDSKIIEASLNLKKGETSDWIEVVNSQTKATTLYIVHVDETDVDAIHKSKNETVKDQLLYAILQSNKGLDVTILEDNAKKLEIKFENKDVETKINDYISKKKGDNK